MIKWRRCPSFTLADVKAGRLFLWTDRKGANVDMVINVEWEGRPGTAWKQKLPTEYIVEYIEPELVAIEEILDPKPFSPKRPGDAGVTEVTKLGTKVVVTDDETNEVIDMNEGVENGTWQERFVVYTQENKLIMHRYQKSSSLRI